MKAVLVSAGVAPDRLVDLSHDLPAHGVEEAAFLLREMARGFPPDTVHVAVVDPGVGGRRRAVAVVTRAGPLLVGPDNGVLAPLAEELGLSAAFRIEATRLHRPNRIGTTFDGRDVFAPAAALLAQGWDPAELGPPVTPARYVLPSPERTPTGAVGEVLHVDRFGNLITNIPTRWVRAGVSRMTVRFATGSGRELPWVTSYEAIGRGSLGCLGSSFGLVELAVREGRASDRLRARVGSAVGLEWGRTPASTSANAKSARPRKRR